jgi:hypothetical protein
VSIYCFLVDQIGGPFAWFLSFGIWYENDKFGSRNFSTNGCKHISLTLPQVSLFSLTCFGTVKNAIVSDLKSITSYSWMTETEKPCLLRNMQIERSFIRHDVNSWRDERSLHYRRVCLFMSRQMSKRMLNEMNQTPCAVSENVNILRLRCPQLAILDHLGPTSRSRDRERLCIWKMTKSITPTSSCILGISWSRQILADQLEASLRTEWAVD